MCGIVGFVQPGGISDRVALPVLSEMSAAIAHRGPDDDGMWLDVSAGVALAHRRLSVVDLSRAGHQPMCSSSGRYVIVFNGEIYNHAEIRRQLDGRSSSVISWIGSSDTEVLLESIERFGLRRTLCDVIGMFAFALWDRLDRTLYLARDRLGEKPLYWGWQNSVFMFGSELKALVAHPSFLGEIDREALVAFLRHNYVPTPWSIYRGIRKLFPGTFVKLPFGERGLRELPEPTRYWSIDDAIERGQERPFEGGSAEAVAALHDMLENAVVPQVAADVPVGAFLSGGIDSTTIVALMQANSSRPIRTFTIGFKESDYDEAVHANEVARWLGTEHHELYASPRDALAVIPRLPSLYDEPFADSSQIPTFLVAEMTRRHVTVALSGDGGDELFGGYQRYFRMRDIHSVLSPIPARIRRTFGRAINAIPEDWGAGTKVLDRARKLAELLSFETKEQLYQGLVSHWREPAAVVRDVSERRSILSDAALWPQAVGLEDRMMAIDAITYLPDDILVKVDRAAMGVSLETRAPFLDHRVVEFAWRLPLSVKIRGRQGKWVLRQVLRRYVPDELVDRPKMGFGVPMASWLRGPLRDWAEALLDEDRLRMDGILNPRPIKERWVQHISGRRRWDASLWTVLMFQAWLEANRPSGTAP